MIYRNFWSFLDPIPRTVSPRVVLVVGNRVDIRVVSRGVVMVVMVVVSWIQVVVLLLVFGVDGVRCLVVVLAMVGLRLGCWVWSRME